ncbi:hypothetical protein E2C01_035274 [Portunus trituberculatus]|uniref:Uncharacterized protein n=1 Tax=Portunus trituberculatus TaxID=210409 RepID=A0A5B7F7W7_PORTR|nr:hypothetical protein [Portunus trituberculatus]
MNTHTTREALEGNGEPGKARRRTYIIPVQSPGEHDKGSAGVKINSNNAGSFECDQLAVRVGEMGR